MSTSNMQEVFHIDRHVRDLLEARDEGAAVIALRKLFVEELDFQTRAGTIALHGAELPPNATRVAERDGVQVVAVRLTTQGRVLVRNIREALKQIRETLNGDILLAAGNAHGGEWHLVYPSLRGEKEILRRIVLTRGQPHRTVVTQLAKAYDQARRGDLRAALESVYDVEAVTKDFFREYSRVFRHAESLITGLPDDNDRRLFCQTLFNRLMFIYFLQRKGWLTFKGSADYLHALWNDTIQRGENFYESRLRLLFFVSLSSPRNEKYDMARSFAEEKTGKVPFLNGGLFSEDRLDKVSDVSVPNEAIEPLLNEIFQRFNFTISESTPYDVQVAVDPEMLGKVFEELVTGRHDTGSYYTPRPIVSFMCRGALKGYLQTQVPELTDEAVSRYVDDNDVSGITQHQATRILNALELITVVDPACGSGAYLLGMMQELLECEIALYNPQLLSGARSLYDMKLRIIERNVYGVDIDLFAVNIAMLRLWLSLIIEYEGNDPPPLPNLDFKIACGDSLTGPNPQERPGDMFRATAAGMADELTELKRSYMRSTGDEKEQLHRGIERRMQDLSNMMAHSDMPPNAIDWRVRFAEVFEQDGFDVVVANPPYVRQENIKAPKPLLSRSYGSLYTSTADLYVYFYYRGFQLLRRRGMLIFISSNKWFRAAYGLKLRRLIPEVGTVRSITDFGELPVFEAASTFPAILVAQVGVPCGPCRWTRVRSLGAPYPDIQALVRQFGRDLPADAVSGDNWLLTGESTAALVRRVDAIGKPLRAYTGIPILRGLLTGFNAAFVISGEERTRLVEQSPDSAEIIKPFARGDDIRRWRIDYQDKWLIVPRIGVDMARYPAVLEHLSQWEPQLTTRQDKGQHWWELRACAYYSEFERPKLVFPDIAKESRFTIDTQRTYLTNTTYFLPTDDLYVLAVLNSSVMWSYAKSRLSVLGDAEQGGRLRFFRQFVQDLPIPVASIDDRTTVAALAQRCLDERGQGPAVEELEEEINARVTYLYGVTSLETAEAPREKSGAAP
jgi:TaqI-like C-terminal specificity domain/Eco57I restriction-modification methylase